LRILLHTLYATDFTAYYLYRLKVVEENQSAGTLTQKKENLNVKIAAHSHNIMLMNLLYWMTGSQLRRCGIKPT